MTDTALAASCPEANEPPCLAQPLTPALVSELRGRLETVRGKLPGNMVETLRVRSGLSLEALSREVRLEAEAILAFEKSGNLRDLDATGDFAWFEESYKETPIERLAGALCPSEEEREVLCTDLNEETAILAKALQDLLGLSDSDASAPAYQDPWENELARARRRRGERGQGLSIVNALGVAPRVVEAPDGEPSPAPGQATFKLQLVTETAEGRTGSVVEIATFSRRAQSIENVGMTLEESKGVLRQLQRTIVQQQVDAHVSSRSACSGCGRKLGKKGSHPIVFRTLFGKLELDSPRLRRCKCHPGGPQSFSPVAELLPERSSPEPLHGSEVGVAGVVQDGGSGATRHAACRFEAERCQRPQPYPAGR